MGEQVKSWRVLKAAGLKVGDSLRMPGDFVPEASDWPSRRAYINADFIEEVWVDEEAIQKNLAEVKERNKPKKTVTKSKTKKRVKAKKKEESDGGRGELAEQPV